MSPSDSLKKVRRNLKHADDIFHIFTGVRMKNVVNRALDFIGSEFSKKVDSFFEEVPGPDLESEDPYKILGLAPDALDMVVKATYRRLAKAYHPDGGETPDNEKFTKATEAYRAIMRERELPEEEVSGKG